MTDKTRTPTLRDQFAMAAATGLSACDEINIRGHYSDNRLVLSTYLDSVDSIAKAAYDIADAMLKEREK